MSSNYGYGYGYDQSAGSSYGYAAAGYVMPSSDQQQQQQVPPPPPPPPPLPPSVGYGGQPYTYYQQQPVSQATPTSAVGYIPQSYTSYSYGGSSSSSYQTAVTAAQTATSSSVSYPNYYQYSKTGSYSAYQQPQTSSAAVSYYQPGVAYSQTGSYSVAYPQTSTYAVGLYSQYATPTSQGSGSSFSYMTPQQQQVVSQYAAATAQNNTKNFFKKRSYDQQQEFYCEVCKVGCGSSLTYKTHLEGKSHKKRLQQAAKITPEPKEESMKCEVCEIVCSNKDSYLAHIKGNKHLKTVNLFRRLGKPLPPMTSSVPLEGGGVQVSAPRITFVGGKKLSSTGLMIDSIKDSVQVYPPGAPKPDTPTLSTAESALESVDVEPVGEHLVKAVKNDPRSPLSSYFCEMCECFFNDDFAKVMHCKGRRHRLNYKKQYDPDLKVDPPKSVSKMIQKRKDKWDDRKRANNSTGPNQAKPVGGGSRARDLNYLRQEEAMALAAYHQEKTGRFYRPQPALPPPPQYHPDWGMIWERPVIIRNPADDKLVSLKHSQLCPTDIEVKMSQKVVQDIETALKSVSDDLLMEQCKRIAVEKGVVVNDPTDIKKDESLREIKGVMRVGLFAHSLMLRGCLDIELVIMCSNVPTRTLLHEVMDILPAKLAMATPPSEQTYHVTADPKKAGLMIISTVDTVTVSVSTVLTSTAVKDTEAPPNASALDNGSCLAGLSSLRQTKWFQAMCHGLPSFSIVMRIFMDLIRRNPVWSVLNEWLLQILIQKCIVSSSRDYCRPGDIFRRVIECIASGVFLPGYPGLLDPCETESIDVANSLTAQQRADLTLCAQHYLRLIAFNQLHLILDIDPPDDYCPYSLRGNEIAPDNGEEEEDTDPAKRPRLEY